MTLILVALRSAVFACGFLWLWTWIAQMLRRFDPSLGGALPVWTYSLGWGYLLMGGVVAAWCVGSFVVRGHGTPALFDAPRRLVAAGPYRHTPIPCTSAEAFCFWATDCFSGHQRLSCSCQRGGCCFICW